MLHPSSAAADTPAMRSQRKPQREVPADVLHALGQPGRHLGHQEIGPGKAARGALAAEADEEAVEERRRTGHEHGMWSGRGARTSARPDGG